MVKAAPSVFEVPSKKRPRMFALAVVVPVPSSKTTRAWLPIAATAGFACQLALAWTSSGLAMLNCVAVPAAFTTLRKTS